MSNNPALLKGSVLALAIVAAIGLLLPALSGALGTLGWAGASLTRRLFLYELSLVALALGVASVIHFTVPGASPGPFSLGALDVVVAPVRWLGLGVRVGSTWRREIVPMTLVITAVTATFVYQTQRASFSWGRAVEHAPFILLFAALNAAGEEWLYRVALLRAAESVVSVPAACVLSAVVFGVAHFGGMPGGPAGALAAGVLGFVLARATHETNGIATAWFVHFLQDVVIFAGWLGARP